MDIQALSSGAPSQTGGSGETRSQELGQQEFLQLLVAQMKNQDPINPLDGADFAAQLAQFNSVEQLIGVNSQLSSLSQHQEMMSTSLNNSLSASLAGKEVRALSDQVWLEPGGNSDIRFELPRAVNEVELVIRSASGTEIRRESLGGLPSGVHEWVWDGRNGAGARQGEGAYHIVVETSSPEGDATGIPFVEGVVDRVKFGDQGVTLQVGGVHIPISDVMEVGERKP